MNFEIHRPIPIQSQVSQTNSTSQDLSRTVELTNCYIDKIARPSNNVEMNTAVEKSILTVITVQKEAFICTPVRGQNLVVDFGIYVISTSTIGNGNAIERGIDATVCVKNQNATVVTCTSEKPEKSIPSAKCSIQRPYSRGSIVMDTESGTDNLSTFVSTIELDADSLRCMDVSGNTIIKNVLTFTEISQNLDDGTIRKSIEIITCAKSINKLQLFGCNVQKIM